MTGSDLPRMDARDAAQGWAEEEGAAVGTPRPPSSGSERAGSDELLGRSGVAGESVTAASPMTSLLDAVSDAVHRGYCDAMGLGAWDGSIAGYADPGHVRRVNAIQRRVLDVIRERVAEAVDA